jgi:hypothetical protein
MPSGLGELSLKAYANIKVGEDFKGYQNEFQTWAETEMPRRRESTVKLLTKNEAPRSAANVAKLPDLLRESRPGTP